MIEIKIRSATVQRRADSRNARQPDVRPSLRHGAKLGSSRRRARPGARLPLRPSRARKQQPKRRGPIGDEGGVAF